MRGALMVAAVLATAPPGNTSTLAPASAAVDLKDALTSLRQAVAALPPNVPTERLSAAAGWLARNYPKAKPEEITEEYARSIQQAADLLDAEPTIEIVDDVTSELEAKVDHCRQLGLGMGGLVTLTVVTRRGGGTVSDWQVLYLLKIYERVSGASPENFPSLSSPTEARVEPGRYWIWARDPATGRSSERALVRVAGQPEIRVDLPVP
jgi:hypothetical protein